MLKIKDNVDLEILEKYKFKHEKDGLEFCSWDYWEYRTEYTEYQIDTKDRQINLYGSDEYENDIDFLYDMIVDGIVEKVGE